MLCAVLGGMDVDEKIVSKIKAELNCSDELAQKMSSQLKTLDKKLKPVVEAWLHDDKIGFDLNGITLDLIMEKEHVSYIQAIFSMNTLLSNPQFAAIYNEFDFSVDMLR